MTPQIEYIIDDRPLIAVKIDLPQGEAFSLQASAHIVAVSDGIVDEHGIAQCSPAVRFWTVYIENDKTDLLELRLSRLSEGEIVRSESTTVHKIPASSVDEPVIPVLFTGRKMMDGLRTKLRSGISPWRLMLEWKSDLVTRFVSTGPACLASLGPQGDEMTAGDLVFRLSEDMPPPSFPRELVMGRFPKGSKLCISQLAKADFQRNVRNLYYKSPASGTVSVPEAAQTLRRLSEFKDPLGSPFNPEEWTVDTETMLPRFVGI